jgi:hypothetical protein
MESCDVTSTIYQSLNPKPQTLNINPHPSTLPDDEHYLSVSDEDYLSDPTAAAAAADTASKNTADTMCSIPLGPKSYRHPVSCPAVA